jgi:hypothetical protein
MSQIDDGGPAFPVPDTYHPNGQVQYGSNGMSLRDWFAGQASNNDILGHKSIIEQSNGFTLTPTVEECKYAYADAMIKARSVFTPKGPAE